MDGDRARTRTSPRIGVVLGAGGVLGAAWMTGALAAVQARLGFPLGDLDVVVGTSAGSVVAAALHCGISVDAMVAYQRGTPTGTLAALGPPDLGCGARPPCPRLRVGSRRLLLTALRRPARVHPLVAATACLPQGRADHATLRAAVAVLAGHRRQHGAQASSEPVPGRRTWIVAVDYDSGRRVVFGRPGAPDASLADMVAASCSVPGWFQPVVIGGHRYVDGGVRSAASADLLAVAGLDEAYVLAPAASTVPCPPRNLPERLERRIRRMFTAGLMREVAALRASGTTVTVLTPGPEDLAVMGANLMDARRRADVLETSLRTSARALGEGTPASPQPPPARAGTRRGTSAGPRPVPVVP